MVDPLEFWERRAALGEAAGTDDVVLKRLEIAEILKYVPRGACVLDVGCGNGLTLQALQWQRACRGVGIDAAPKMIEAAQVLQVPNMRFEVGSVLDPLPHGDFELIISERCLINLQSEAEQHRAFVGIMDHLRPGGTFLMMENSYEGLGRLNAIRHAVDLPGMTAAWHNLYFEEEAVVGWATTHYILQEMVPFTSTYYLLSRVVYAKLAAGQPLVYESPINLLALTIPPVGDLGATRLWVWRKF